MRREGPVAALIVGGLTALAVGKQKGESSTNPTPEPTLELRGPPPCQHPDCDEDAEAPGYDYCGDHEGVEYGPR